jgi:hypothetical protein
MPLAWLIFYSTRHNRHIYLQKNSVIGPNLGQSTISGKSKAIRDMFKIYQLDPKWCLPSRLDANPMAWMISINGFILDARHVTRDIQEAAYQAGLIPYIPGDRNA